MGHFPEVGGAASGPAGGDLAGAYPDPTLLRISGNLDHNGANVGFYGVAPVARPAVYQQDFAGAIRTVNGTDLGAFVGTNVGPHGFSSAADFNNFRSGCDNLKQVVNSVINDLQANGLLQ